MSTDDRPLVFLYTPQTLPLFRDWMLKQHPFPESFRHRPLWITRGGPEAPPESAIFARLPEDPVDARHHPHFWAMKSDVNGVALHDAAFRFRVLGQVGHGIVRTGYHVNASYAQVRAFFAEHARLLEAEDLVREQAAKPRPSEADTLDVLANVFRIVPRSPRSRAAMHDYLHGGGDVPPAGGRVPKLIDLFTGVSPLAFNEVHLRALDLLARAPEQLREIEHTITTADPTFDLHSIWRDTLRSRGVDELVIEDCALRACLGGDPVHTRAWWLLLRAAADPGAFLDRHHAMDVHTLHRRLLYASWITWDLPQFRALTEELVASHGHRLEVNALLTIFDGKHQRRSADLVGRNLGAVVKGRPPEEATRLYEAVEQAAQLSSDDESGEP